MGKDTFLIEDPGEGSVSKLIQVAGRIQFLVVVGLVELLVSLPTVSHRPLLAPSVRLDFLTCGLLSLNPAMAHQILTVFQMSDFCHQLEKTVLLKGLCG